MTAQGLTQRPTGNDEFSGFRVQPGMVVAGILAFLTVIGAAAGLARLFVGLGGTTTLDDSTSWGIWIGFDFGLIAFAGAAFTMAAVVHVFHLHQFEPVLRPAVLAGLLGYTAVLLILVLDLGRPDRFYNFLLYFNLHSPLFEICWCVLLYSTVLVFEVAPDFLEKFGWSKLRRFTLRAMPVATVVGVTLSSLHQSTLGTLFLNMPHRISPLWWTPILPLLFLISAVMAGLSMGIVSYRVAARIHSATEQPAVIMGLMKGLIGVGTLYLALRIGALVLNGSLADPDWSLASTWVALIEIVGLGVLPVLLCAVPAWRRSSAVQWAAPLMFLGGVLLNRFSAALFGNTPVIDRGVYLPSAIEWLTTIGIIAMAVLAWYACVRWLVRFDDHSEHSH